MYPHIELFGLRFGTYSLTYALAMLAGGMLCYTRLTGGGVTKEKAGTLVLATIWAGLLGAKAATVIPAAVQSWIVSGELRYAGGSAFMGGLAMALGTFVLLSHRFKLPLGIALDMVMPIIPLGQAIGRLGCLARGCCFGQLADGWPAMYLPDVNGTWLMRYPTQLMCAAADILIFGVLLAVERNRRTAALDSGPKGDGLILPLYLALYSSKRFSIEFLRADAWPLIGRFSLAHIAAAAIFCLAVALIVRKLRRAKVEA